MDGPHRAELIGQLEAAAEAADQAGQAWADVRIRWRGLRTPTEHGPANVLRRETSDLTTRVGRLVHTDPTWRPRLDADHQLRTGAQLAPDQATLSRLLDGLRELNASTVDIAVDHLELTQALHQQELLLVRTRTLSSEYDTPRAWTTAPTRTIQKLAIAQHDATAASRQSWAGPRP